MIIDVIGMARTRLRQTKNPTEKKTDLKATIKTNCLYNLNKKDDLI